MTQEEQKLIIDSYINETNLSLEQIAQKFNISSSTVSRIIRINNIPKRSQNIKEKNQEQIIEEYLKGKSKLYLSKKYNTSTEHITKILKENNITKISLAKQKNPNLIEDYFKNIDTKDKAYWLGWIISDGSIIRNEIKNRYELAICLSSKDEYILHLLEQDLKVENKVTTFNEKYKRFYLCCKSMINDLYNLGITQNKSHTVKMPILSKELMPHLIRGIFDGDGGFSVYTRKNGQKCQELSFCGNVYIVSAIAETLFNSLSNLTHNSITDEASIKRIRWGSKKDIKLIKDYLYKDCDIHYLKRKYDLIQANTEVTN